MMATSTALFFATSRDTSSEDVATQFTRVNHNWARASFQLATARQGASPSSSRLWNGGVDTGLFAQTHLARDHDLEDVSFHREIFTGHLCPTVPELLVQSSQLVGHYLQEVRKLRDALSHMVDQYEQHWLKVLAPISTGLTFDYSEIVSLLTAKHHSLSHLDVGESEWTDAKNQRRADLVDKEIKGTISEMEEAELERLQAEMLAYRRKVAPLPLDELRAPL